MKDILAKTITLTIINIIALAIISCTVCNMAMSMEFMYVLGIMYALIFIGAYIMIISDSIKNAVISAVVCSLISPILILASLFIIKPTNEFTGIAIVYILLIAFKINIVTIVVCSIADIIIKNEKRRKKHKDEQSQ